MLRGAERGAFVRRGGFVRVVYARSSRFDLSRTNCLPRGMTLCCPVALTSCPQPTPRPTINIEDEAELGCTAFADTDACARVPQEVFKLLFPRGSGSFANQMFGSSTTFVGTTGGIVAVGSGTPGLDVHLYQKRDDTWEYLTSLSLVEWETADVRFGVSLASNEAGFIAVGAPLVRTDLLFGNEATSGRVYVYRPNSNFTRWDMVARLTYDDNDFAPGFGSSVAFHGSLIAVGSPDETLGKGAAYVFEASSIGGAQGNLWARAARLVPDDLADGAMFGASVSIYGDAPATLAVGAPSDAEGAGSAYLYVRRDFSWVPNKLVYQDPTPGDRFGSGVVVSGCSVAVTSPGDTMANETGAVRVFDLDEASQSWVHAQTLNSASLPGNVFGECIAMEGNTILVGSLPGESGADRSDYVYHYERIGGLWIEISIISIGGFECPLSLSGNLFLAGSPKDSSLGVNSGSAYIFDLCPPLEES
ncbi:hypothetical protein ACHAWF_015165 [Thalassiosira exigua]